MTDCTTPKICW